VEPHGAGSEILPRAGGHEGDESDQGEHQGISEIESASGQERGDPQSELEGSRMAYVFHHAGNNAGVESGVHAERISPRESVPIP